MPNWCENQIVISGPQEKIKELFNKLDEGKLLESIWPMPENVFLGSLGENERTQCEEQGIPNWYDWCCDNWGTKWDVVDPVFNMYAHDVIVGTFLTAWGPPINAYANYLNENTDMTISADYFESGMGFVGTWENGEDEWWEFYDMDEETLQEQVPAHLIKVFKLDTLLEEMKENEELG